MRHKANMPPTTEQGAKNPVGRPQGETNNQDKLIHAARELFIEHDYAKVSIREIANKAGTDSGLIRYYFGSKQGLFTAMIHETAKPVIKQLNKSQAQLDDQAPIAFMRTYYKVMSAHPHFPRLIFKLANLDPEVPENKELTDILDKAIAPKVLNMFDNLAKYGVLKQGVDPKSALLSLFCMTVFPFIIPDKMLKKMDIQITPEFLDTLANHNAQLMSLGLFAQKEQNDEK